MAQTDAYTVELEGKYFSIDGGENNFQGPSGWVATTATAQEAVSAAKKYSSEQSFVIITKFANEGSGKGRRLLNHIVKIFDGGNKAAIKW